MRVKPLLISFCLLLVLNLTACSGYNNIMYKHLSNVENYKIYTVVVENIYVCNKETRKLEKYDETIHDASFLSATVYFAVSELNGFYAGEHILSDGTRTESMVLLEVLTQNSETLLENDFYKDFKPGNVIEIQCSDLVYMDTNFYYAIGIKYGEIQYLNSEDGLQNIVDMMDKDRSLF